MALNDRLCVVTDCFEHRNVGPHFINPCCFGEDFAAWLSTELSPLKEAGFRFSEPIQEDYGWGFWVRHGPDSFWIALSYVGEGPQEPPAEWIVQVAYDAGPNIIKRFLHTPDARAFARLRDTAWQALTSNPEITVLGPVR